MQQTAVVSDGCRYGCLVKVNDLAFVLGADEDSSQKRGSEREQTVRALVRLVYQLVHCCDTKKAGMAAPTPAWPSSVLNGRQSERSVKQPVLPEWLCLPSCNWCRGQ